MKRTKIISLLLVIVLTVSIITGCQSRDAEESSSSSSSSSRSSSSSSAPQKTGEKTVSSIQPDLVKEVLDKKAINADTVGWLQIPELGIDDVVVCNKESNEYYRRKNFEKQDNFNGVLYADRRSEFGDGTFDKLGVNTCVYGHAMTDDKANKKYDVFFGPLHDLRDPEIAKSTPYMFFSTEKETLTFEIFAIFIANTDNSDLPYNRNDIEPDKFREIVKKEVLPRSIYNYDVDLKDNDKFLTLSTCIYVLPNGTKTGYPNTYYRYAVMGRFVGPDEPLKTEATLALNPNPVIDPDGKIHSK